MQPESSVFILWDASHIWGLMAWRALRALGVPSRLVKAEEIAQGALSGKPGHGVPGLLLVPGGSAGRKAALLGQAGREAVRGFVRRGGAYLGFCGGAGLALSHIRENQGLGLCPWTRAPYALRFQHLVSGHVLAHAPGAGAGGGDGRPLSLPVWWPGRFAPQEGPRGVTILATAVAPDADLWLADLPLAGLSPRVLETWRVCYGVDLAPDFLAGQPLVVSGNYGEGRYLLSYSHLETPESPAANAWLGRILAGLGMAVPHGDTVPAWDLGASRATEPGDGATLVAELGLARARILALLALGVDQRLFFRRTSWLWGWRSGLPGITLNNLAAALAELEALALRENLGPAEAGVRARLEQLWQVLGPRLAALLPVFAEGAESWLMASRLADLLAPTLPDAVDARGLVHQRGALFGHPMQGGGLAEELLQIAEEGIFAAQALAPGREA